mgnify:CR=1 FL=1
MQSSNIYTSFKAEAAQPILPTRTSLTVGSTRTPTQAMPSALSWPVLVPSAFGSGAG